MPGGNQIITPKYDSEASVSFNLMNVLSTLLPDQLNRLKCLYARPCPSGADFPAKYTVEFPRDKDGVRWMAGQRREMPSVGGLGDY